MKFSEVPDYLKGNVCHNADGTMAHNHPEKGLIVLEGNDEDEPLKTKTIEDRLDNIENYLSSITKNINTITNKS